MSSPPGPASQPYFSASSAEAHPAPVTPLAARVLSVEEHEEFLRRHPEASFLQNPRWGAVKHEWRSESVGLLAEGRVVGAALVLYRRLPVPAGVPFLGRASLAYITEGPVLDDVVPLAEALRVLIAHVKAVGAFELRLGMPGVVRRWDGDAVRRALKATEHARLSELESAMDEDRLAEQETLRSLGFRAPEATDDFGMGQPLHQARIPLEGDAEAVLLRMNQTSRSETRKSARTGLTIEHGGRELLPAFHALYLETAEREHFTGRPLSYFERLLDVMGPSPIAEVEVLVASYEDDPLAAALAIRQGQFAWYPYGGSTTRERKRHAPRALQLEQITSAVESGRCWYDLGGVSGSLSPDHKASGLTLFKTAMGADIVQTHGEWSLPLNRALSAAFHLYLKRRC